MEYRVHAFSAEVAAGMVLVNLGGDFIALRHKAYRHYNSPYPFREPRLQGSLALRQTDGTVSMNSSLKSDRTMRSFKSSCFGE